MCCAQGSGLWMRLKNPITKTGVCEHIPDGAHTMIFCVTSTVFESKDDPHK